MKIKVIRYKYNAWHVIDYLFNENGKPLGSLQSNLITKNRKGSLTYNYFGKVYNVGSWEWGNIKE